MALQGTLETFALPDVLRLLASTKKTGAYRLDGDRGSGLLWIKDGEVVAGEFAGSPMTDPIEAAFELLRFADGDFVFDADAEATDPVAGIEIEKLLEKAEAMLEEWKGLEAVVPSLDHGLHLNPALPGDEVTIRADTWIYLVAIGAGTTVGRLGKKLQLGELGVARAVKDMIELGVVELSEPGTVTDEPEPELDSEPAVEESAVESVESFESFESFTTDSTDDFVFDPNAPFEVPDEEFTGDTSFLDAPLISEPDLVPSASEPEPVEEFEPFDPNALLVDDSSDAVEFDEAAAQESFLGGGSDSFLQTAEPEPLLESEPEPAPAADLGASDPTDAAEIARQLANLSPKAAKAVAAAAKATTQEEREAALAEVDETEDPINRDLLLKFLGSVNS